MQISYDSLQISIIDGSVYQRISSLEMPNDRDTILIARGLRSDNGTWEPVSGNWSMSGGFGSSTTPPNPGQTWNFSPIDTGSGTITVTRGSLSATISVVVTTGSPYSISIYPNATDSSYTGPPSYFIDSAGVAFPLYAKVFDSRGY